MSTDDVAPASDFTIIARLAKHLSDPDFATGDHAALRRMDPRAPGRAAIACPSSDNLRQRGRFPDEGFCSSGVGV
jgi:hypothetical protein